MLTLGTNPEGKLWASIMLEIVFFVFSYSLARYRIRE